MRKTKICGFLSRDMLRAAGSIAILGVTASAFAQVSGTWTNLGATPSFSDPNNWSSFPQVPGDGGEVVFNGPYRSQTAMVLPNDLTISKWANVGSPGIRTTSAGSVTFTGPAEVFTDVSTVTPSEFRGFIDGIAAPIFGNVGLSKTGSGVFALTGTNFFSGGTRVNGGWVAATSDASLGAAGSSLTLNSGGLFAFGSHLNRQIHIDLGGGAINARTTGTISFNNVSGTGTLSLQAATTAFATTGIVFVAPIVHSGTLSIENQHLRLTRSSDGATYGQLTSSSVIRIKHMLTVSDGTFTPPGGAINDNAVVVLHGGSLTFSNTGGAPETIGVLRLESGGGVTTGSFTAASLQRDAGATMRFIDSARQPAFLTAPAMVGSGPVGTPTVGVVPYVYTSTTAITPVTYDTGRLRPLNATEFATVATLPSPNSPDVNLRAANHNFVQPVSVRSLLVENQGVSGATITVNGGGVYLSTPSAVAMAPLDFGNQEGFVNAAFSAVPSTFSVISSPIGGSAGVTLSGNIALTGASTYTGPTYVNGMLEIRGNVAEGSPSPLGLDTSAVMIRPSAATSGLLQFVNTNILVDSFQFDRDLDFESPLRRQATIRSSGVDVIINGDISVDGVLGVGSSLVSRKITLNGNVSGSGALRIDGPVLIAGNNTYTGGTSLNGTLQIASDQALGSGPLWHELVTTSMRTLEAIGAPRALANELRLENSASILRFAGGNSLRFTSPVTMTDSATIDLQATAPLTFAGGASNHVITTTGTGTLQLAWYRGRGIDVRGGRVAFLPGENQTSSRAESIAIQTGTALDLNDHTLILDFGGGTITGGEAGVRGLLSDGRLISSVAQANPGTAIGYALAGDVLAVVGGGAPVLYADQLVRAEDLLVRYTLAGDADLNGVVNISDFSRLAANFNLTNAVWSRGDFNYDGVTGIGDFAVLASNFNESLPRSSRNVPEPSSLLVLAIAAALKCHRRRR